MIKAGLEMACFTTHVRLRTLPDSMKTLGLPNIDAIASAKQKNKGIKSQYTIGLKCVIVNIHMNLYLNQYNVTKNKHRAFFQ
jgi:hypothetical protein